MFRHYHTQHKKQTRPSFCPTMDPSAKFVIACLNLTCDEGKAQAMVDQWAISCRHPNRLSTKKAAVIANDVMLLHMDEQHVGNFPASALSSSQPFASDHNQQHNPQPPLLLNNHHHAVHDPLQRAEQAQRIEACFNESIEIQQMFNSLSSHRRHLHQEFFDEFLPKPTCSSASASFIDFDKEVVADTDSPDEFLLPF